MDVFENTANLRPGLALAATDAIFLGTNSKDTVIAVGAVPTATALGDMPGLRVDAQDAVSVAQQLTTDFGAIEGNFTKLGEDFTAIQEDFGGLQGAFQGLKPETLTQLPVVVQQLQQAVQTAQMEIKDVGGQLERANQMQTRRVDETLNEVLSKVLEGGGGRLGIEGVARAPLVRSLESLSLAVEAAAPARAREDVRGALEEGRPALDALRGATVEEVDERQAAGAALESILAGLRAAGLSTDSTEYRRARREVTKLQKLLGTSER